MFVIISYYSIFVLSGDPVILDRSVAPENSDKATALLDIAASLIIQPLSDTYLNVFYGPKAHNAWVINRTI